MFRDIRMNMKYSINTYDSYRDIYQTTPTNYSPTKRHKNKQLKNKQLKNKIKKYLKKILKELDRFFN